MTAEKIEKEVKELTEKEQLVRGKVENLRLLNNALQVAVDLQKKVKKEKSE